MDAQVQENRNDPIAGKWGSRYGNGHFKGSQRLLSKGGNRIMREYGPIQGLVQFPHMTESGILGIEKYIV